MRESRSIPTRSKALSDRLKAWGGLALLVLSSACGQIKNTSSSALTTNCVLSADQGGTLTGRWTQPSVPIAFHTGDWNSSEMAAMIAAADKWNSFFAASMGYPAIDYGTAASPRTSSAALTTDQYDFCANETIVNTDATFSAPVVIYKKGTWSYDSDIIALTSVCKNTVSGKTLPRFSNSYMEFNYVNFFVNGNRVPDLQSIVLHEMGHLMGINHSCEVSSTTAGVPNCSSSSLAAVYKSASMYPSFSFSTGGTGEVRRSLNSNDQGRMNCVYKYL